MVLENELSQHLDNDEEPLRKRLCDAQIVYLSTQMAIPNKEDIILNWMCRLASKSSSFKKLSSSDDHEKKDVKNIWTALQACIKSNRIHRFNVLDLRPSSKAAVVEVINKHLKKKIKEESEFLSLLECVTCVLESVSFQKYLRQDIPLLCDLLKNILTCLQYACVEDNLKIRIVMSIRTCYRETVLQNDLSSSFLKTALYPLINLCIGRENCPAALSNEVKKCFEQVLFPKASVEFTQFLDVLFRRKVPDLKSTSILEKDKHPVPFNIMDALGESHDIFSEEAVFKLYKTVLESFLGGIQTHSSPSAFQMFISLCHLVGIKTVNTKCKINYKVLGDCLKHCMTEPTALSLKILKGLVDVLSIKAVPLNSEICGTTFLDWLQMVVENLFSSSINVAREELFELLASFTKLNPFTVEANMENIFSLITSKPLLEAEKSSYSELIEILFKMYHKMNRIHKILGIFLSSLENGLMKHSGEADVKNWNICYWLPPEISVKFSEFALKMPSESAIATFEVLLSSLKKGISLSFSSNQLEELYGEVFLKAVCELSCAMFKGIRMVESSVASHPRVGFCKVMKDFRDCLYVMGHSLLKGKNLSAMKPFLSLSHLWGAEALLIKQYAMVGRAALLESIGSNDISVCEEAGLSHTHPYLSNEEWVTLRDKANACEDMECADLFVQLDFQLLCAVQLQGNPLPDGKSELARQCLSQVLQKSHTINYTNFMNKEIVFDLLFLSQMLETSDVLELSERLVALLVGQYKCNGFKKTVAVLSERRTLACALIFSTLLSLERALKILKRKKSDSCVNTFSVSKAVLKDLKSSCKYFVEAEVQQSSGVSDSVKNSLQSMTISFNELLRNSVGKKENSTQPSCDVNLMVIINHVALLQELPLQCLMVPSRFAIFLSLFSLAVECSCLPSSPEQNHLMSIVCDKILVGLAERKLFLRRHQDFSQHLVDRYLAQVTVSMNLSCNLLEMIMSEAMEEENVLDYVIEMVSFLNKKFSKQKASKEFTLLATVLMQNVVGRKRLFEVNPDSVKDESQLEKVGSAVETLVYSLCHIIEEQNGKPKDLMNLYALALDFLIKRKNIKKAEDSLIPQLEDYCSVAISKLQSQNRNQCRAAEALLTSVFVHHKILQQFLPSNLLRDVWAALIQTENPKEGPVKLFSLYISKEILDELILKTVETYRAIKEKNVEMSPPNLIELWCALLNCSTSLKVNADLWLYAVRKLLDGFHTFNRVPPKSSLTFLHKVISTTEIVLDMEMIDQCLLVLNGIELPSDVSEFVSIGEKYLSVLSAIFFHRHIFALDCVPNLFQKLQILIRKLGYQSRAKDDLMQANITALADLGYNVEKFVSSFTRPDFKVALKRVAAYLIADIISVFEVVTLCSAVKVHYQNMVYILISMIDKHSIQFLLRAMSPASTEIFKSLYATYNKLHAFKGKI